IIDVMPAAARAAELNHQCSISMSIFKRKEDMAIQGRDMPLALSVFGGKADITQNAATVFPCADRLARPRMRKLWLEITRPSRSSRLKQQSKLQKLFVNALTLAEPLAWRLRSF
ncbi:MAG: hypothetical protein WB537_21105, partial [Pseudolabrys sp.]